MHIDTSKKWAKYVQIDKLKEFYDPHPESDREKPVVVDMHTHPALKMRSPFNRLHITRRLYRERSTFFPLSRRTAFNRLHEGGVHIIFSGAVASEPGFAKDIKFLSWIGISLRLLSILRKLAGRRSHRKATVVQLERVEKKVSAYNRSRYRRHKKIDDVSLPEARVVKNNGELDAALQAGHIAVIHSIEGAHSLEGDVTRKLQQKWPSDAYNTLRGSDPDARNEVLESLDMFADKYGLGYLTLGHYYPNEVAATTFSYPQRITALVRPGRWRDAWRDPTLGLTDTGFEVVHRMCELGILIDVAHITPAARHDVYEVVTKFEEEREEEPGQKSRVIASHVGAFAINPDPYNLADDEIQWFAEHSGLVCVMFSNYWLTGHDGSQLGINYIVQTIGHFIQAGGLDIVAIGTDFDGLSDPPDDLVDSAEMYRLTLRLLEADFLAHMAPQDREQAVAAILGGNALRVLRTGWTVGP